MIIIFGSKIIRNEINNNVNHNCSICQYQDSKILSTWKWFTLFWVPIFPIGKKKYWLICKKCSNGYALTKEQISEMN